MGQNEAYIRSRVGVSALGQNPTRSGRSRRIYRQACMMVIRQSSCDMCNDLASANDSQSRASTIHPPKSTKSPRPFVASPKGWQSRAGPHIYGQSAKMLHIKTPSFFSAFRTNRGASYTLPPLTERAPISRQRTQRTPALAAEKNFTEEGGTREKLRAMLS